MLLLYSCFYSATQELFIERQTETSITVHYTPLPGVIGSQLVARNWKLGRFFGTCDNQGKFAEYLISHLAICTKFGCVLAVALSQRAAYSEPCQRIFPLLPNASSYWPYGSEYFLLEMKCVIFTKALTFVEVSPESTTSVRVTMTTVGGNTDVTYYEADYQHNYCTVSSSQFPLSCTLGKLSPGTMYRVSGMACMADSACSYKRFGSVYTFPDRKSISSNISPYIVLYI